MHDLTSTGRNGSTSNYRNIGGLANAPTMSCKREAMTLDVSTTAGSCAPPPDKRPRMTDLALHGLSSCAKVGGNADSAEKGGALLPPTPTQFLFPKRGTEEQEDYVRGFSQALEAIYQRNSVGACEPPMSYSVPLVRVVGPEGSSWTTVSTSSCSSGSFVSYNQNILFPSTISSSVPFSTASSCLISLTNPMMTSSQGITVTSALSSQSDRYSFIPPTYLTSHLSSRNHTLPAPSVFTTLQNFHPSRATLVPPAASKNFRGVKQNVNTTHGNSFSHTEVI